MEKEFEIELHGKVSENWGWESFVLTDFHEKVCEDSFSEELIVRGAWWVYGGGRVRG